ncbi:hypothetical protein J2T56_002498 [Natronobacillus azotifigens]|uniref:Uncharacterized protein n=1 Tax=Natronobacillus azotifigens TaxID=472978 RepID=A0A9J6REY0_9BACI|nr:hypothetical protein [Natronobacillus azotifigens]MCZ0704200.1 hypothetical protein [Natronobacillus azotifigens]
MNPIVVFSHKPSVGLLNIDTMELLWLQRVQEKHAIFSRIESGFDYYYLNDILIIPDPRKTIPCLEKAFYLGDLKVDCEGEYILFFNFKLIENIIFAESLSLPSYKFIKDNIRSER